MSETTPKRELTVEDVIEGRLPEVTDVSYFYANGFTVFRGNSDAGILFSRSNKPIIVVNLSFTTAKTLVDKLGSLVADLEAATGRPIMTTTFIDEAVARGESSPSKDDSTSSE